jgi:hypothetical protein
MGPGNFVVAFLLCFVAFALCVRFSPGFAHLMLSSFFEFRDIPKEVPPGTPGSWVGQDGKTYGLYLRRYFLTPRRWLSEPCRPDGTGGSWPRILRWVPPKWRRQMFLHNIRLSDERTPHDHPWGFISLILWGAYREFIFPNPGRHRGARERLAFMGRILRNKATHTHYVKIIRPVWSLVVAEHASREWGFWQFDPSSDEYGAPCFGRKWVDWRTYLKCPDAPTEPEDRFFNDPWFAIVDAPQAKAVA